MNVGKKYEESTKEDIDILQRVLHSTLDDKELVDFIITMGRPKRKINSLVSSNIAIRIIDYLISLCPIQFNQLEYKDVRLAKSVVYETANMLATFQLVVVKHVDNGMGAKTVADQYCMALPIGDVYIKNINPSDTSETCLSKLIGHAMELDSCVSGIESHHITGDEEYLNYAVDFVIKKSRELALEIEAALIKSNDKKMIKENLHMERTMATTLTGAEVKKALSAAVGGIYRGKDVYQCVPISIFKDYTVTEAGIVIRLNNCTTMTIEIEDDETYVNFAIPGKNIYEEWHGSGYFEYAFNFEGYDIALCFNTGKADGDNEITIPILKELVGDGKSDLKYSVSSEDSGELCIDASNADVEVNTDDGVIYISTGCTTVTVSLAIVDKVYNQSLDSGNICYDIVFNNGMPPMSINMYNIY